MPTPSPSSRDFTRVRAAVPAPIRRRLRRGVAELRRRRARARHPLCENVEAWGRRQGVESVPVVRRVSTTRRPPNTVEPAVHEKYLDNMTHEHSAVSMTMVEGAKLFGRNGLVMLPDDSVALQAVNGREVLYSDADYLRYHPRPVRSMEGTYFSMLTSWARANYYHWVHDSLQRLASAQALLPADTRFAVPASLTDVQRDSLRVLGVDDDRMIAFTGDEEWRLERLAFVPPIVWTSHSRRDELTRLRNRVLGHYGIAPTPGTRRLFVSRRTAAERRMQNEEEVEEFLAARGFETVVCDQLSFHEQVQTFAEAEMVVSTHGAHITNILFSPPGTVVVEMIEPGIIHNAHNYWTMADEIDLEYWYFLATSVPRPGFQNDTFVPVDKLARTLDAIACADAF